MKETPVRVMEGNDPTVTFRLRLKEAGGDTVEFPTAGSTFNFCIKDTRSAPDPPTPIPMTVISANPAIVAVSLTAAQVGAPGERFYRVDAVDANGRKQTVALGAFIVEDV